ncbi:hypothetical protein, partial [Bacillus amyloliquefaciens]|uniref:hypothetical protein n=1 Tax=Bacillus amyloliquefaciens TaxID=1390 RepID=UPI00197A9A1C
PEQSVQTATPKCQLENQFALQEKCRHKSPDLGRVFRRIAPRSRGTEAIHLFDAVGTEPALDLSAEIELLGA